MICPQCLVPCSKTSWKPPSGYHPRMKKHQCPHCKTEYYVVPIPTCKELNDAQRQSAHMNNDEFP